MADRAFYHRGFPAAQCPWREPFAGPWLPKSDLVFGLRKRIPHAVPHPRWDPRLPGEEVLIHPRCRGSVEDMSRLFHWWLWSGFSYVWLSYLFDSAKDPISGIMGVVGEGGTHSCVGALRTPIGLFPCVSPLMRAQMIAAREDLSAHMASVGLDSGMQSHMSANIRPFELTSMLCCGPMVLPG